MLAHRLRRWPNISPIVAQCLVFGWCTCRAAMEKAREIESGALFLGLCKD